MEKARYRTSNGEEDPGAFWHLLRESRRYLGAPHGLIQLPRLVSLFTQTGRDAGQQIIDGGVNIKSGVRRRRQTLHAPACASAMALSRDLTLSSSPQGACFLRGCQILCIHILFGRYAEAWSCGSALVLEARGVAWVLIWPS